MDLNAEDHKLASNGLEWAAAQAQLAIYNQDTTRLKELVTAYPGLLTWRDLKSGNVLLQATTSDAEDAATPAAEKANNRPECAEWLIDAGAVVDARVWERVLHTGSAGMLHLLERKGVLPHTLPIRAALGDAEASGMFPDSTIDVIHTAVLHACRFQHKAIALALLERSIAMDPDLGRKLREWEGRCAFIEYLCVQTARCAQHHIAEAPGSLWGRFVALQLFEALEHRSNLAHFAHWLDAEPEVLSEAFVPVQVRLLEIATYPRKPDFMECLLDHDPALLHLPKPPVSRLVTFAVAQGHAVLVPLLTRVWPLPNDLPHAAGMGDMARVQTWFAHDGSAQLGDPRAHYPGSSATVQQVLDHALAWACLNCQFAVADFLLAHGANINTRWGTSEPASILHECVVHGNFRAAKFLIDHGIDMTIRDERYGHTAEEWAVEVDRMDDDDGDMEWFLIKAERARAAGWAVEFL